MPGLQATDLLATLPACSGRRHSQLCRLSHECKLGDQTRDDADKEPREERSCGRSQTSLYNAERPHSSLGYLTPNEYVANWLATRSPNHPPDASFRTATGRTAAVCGASAPRPVAEVPVDGQNDNGLNL